VTVQKFVVGGWFILGPDTNILALTIFLISAPSTLFNVFVATELRDWSLVRHCRKPAHGPTSSRRAHPQAPPRMLLRTPSPCCFDLHDITQAKMVQGR
jgi:hypothetical protein